MARRNEENGESLVQATAREREEAVDAAMLLAQSLDGLRGDIQKLTDSTNANATAIKNQERRTSHNRLAIALVVLSLLVDGFVTNWVRTVSNQANHTAIVAATQSSEKNLICVATNQADKSEGALVLFILNQGAANDNVQQKNQLFEFEAHIEKMLAPRACPRS